jgi:hydroxyacylglutathione hydrolase
MIVWKDEQITLFRSVLYETVSSVIMTDDCVLVVDPCWLPHEVEEIRRYVDSVRGDRLLYLLFTHSDYDHIIGYGAFRDAVVIASGSFQKKSSQEKEAIIEEIKAFDDEYYITRNYEVLYPNVDIAVREDEISIDIGQTRLTFFQAPGHNDDGLFTIIEEAGVFLAGDYFSDIEFPYIYHSSIQYEKTISKLNYILDHYDIRLFVTGHGNPTCHLSEIRKRQQDSFRYIQQMRGFVEANSEKEIQKLIHGCKFPRNMKKFHHQNKLLFQKEMKK